MGPAAPPPHRSEASAPSARARLFGALELELDGAPVPSLESTRAESLLAYLLLHCGAALQRRRLAFLLWPDSTEEQAHTNLRHVLHKLRRALPDADRWIEASARTLCWRADAALWLDVAAFEEAITEGRLEDAVATYSGPLLEDHYEDWLLEERERLAHLHLEALERLARRCNEEGRWDEAVRHAEQLLRQDPLREDIYRLLMAVHGASGDRARAMRTYHACMVTLQRELGIAPSATTRRAYDALLPPGEATDRPAPAAGPPLVGRSEERARLAAAWRDAERGTPQLVVLSGEPGVGKTRLAEELRAWAAHRGAVTAEARAYPAEGRMAFGLLVGWLRSEAVTACLAQLEPARLGELARLLPELGGAAPLELLGADEQRRRIFDAAARAIHIAGEPLLLLADDLQWSDAETLRFLAYLLRADPTARLLVAATARREEVDDGHPAGNLFAALQAHGRCTEIALGRLGPRETAVLAESVAERRLSGEEAELLFHNTEGNPLFVLEALRSGALDPGTAPRVQSVIDRRLAQLSEPGRHVAGIAATIGREFTSPQLAEAAALDERDLVGGLDELWRRGLVRAHGPVAYDFSHGLIREAAYRALGPAQARDHHLRVAGALERSGQQGQVSGRIAAHYEAAGDAAAAAAWYVRAAEAAQRLHAGAAAVDALEHALALARRLPSGRERAALELRVLTAFPPALVTVAGYLSGRTAEVHEAAHALAAEHGFELEPPLLRSLALAHLTRGDFAAAEDAGRRLHASAQRGDDDVARVEGSYVLGVADFWRGRLESARTHLTDAVNRYRPARRDEHVLRYGQDPEVVCLMRLAYTHWLLGRDAESDEALRAVRTLAEASRNPYSRSITGVWSAMLALDRADEEELRRLVETIRVDVAADWQLEFATDAFSGYLDALDGRTEGVRRLQRIASQVRARPSAPGIAGFLVRVLVAACAAAGDPGTGAAAARAALGMGCGAELWEAELHRLLAGFLRDVGATPVDVEAELLRAVAVAERQGARVFERRAREDYDRIAARAPSRNG